MSLDFQVLCQQIEQAYAGLSPQLKRAARHALDHPDDIALLSMRQFAAKAEVHPSTMVRLVKVLGLSGYTVFQEPFQARLRSRPEEHYSKSARSIQALGNRSVDLMLTDMLEMEHTNLDSLIESIGFDHLHETAQMISDARHVYVAGVRSCYPAAFYFRYACCMFVNKVTLLEDRGGTFADDLRRVEKDDVVLAISFAPYSRTTVRAVEYAIKRGGQVIALTDSSVSPLLTSKKTRPLIVRTSSLSFFHSVVPAMAVVQALVLLMVAKGGENALNELSESEAQLSACETYWHNGEPKKTGGGVG
ncbi:MAG: MurR/RpiR family transcriptional regulator [Magnetovibrio sp.]|nr:MurR/RpiR family transcriptional regulator [Magnetovibrio sp.]